MWTIEFIEPARRELRKLDKTVQKRIFKFLRERISTSENPRVSGKALSGRLSGLWRYRAGDYCIVCRILDQQLQILVVRIAHRKTVYRT